MVLGKLPPNPKTNPNRTPNRNCGTIFLGGNSLVAPPPTLKLTLTLTKTPTLTGGGGFCSGEGGGGGNFPDTSLNKTNVFCLLITDYDITKKLKIKEKITSQILCLPI